MKYSIELRMKNQSTFLLSWTERNSFDEAFKTAIETIERAKQDEFVQVRNEKGEVVASFGLQVGHA